MSDSKKLGKVIGRYTIGFDEETKAEIATLKDSLDAVSHCLSAGNVVLTGGILSSAKDTAANDSYDIGLGDCLTLGRELDKKLNNNTTELKQLGQSLFEGYDECWVHIITDKYGCAFKFKLVPPDSCFGGEYKGYGPSYIGSGFEPRKSITRQSINDVDYLSETVPEIQGMDAREIIIDDLWQDKTAPQITQADMQLIFIKNLSEVLVQRMHSMERFSHDDYTIGVAEFMPWDIVFDRVAKAFGVITNTHTDSTVSAVFFPKRDLGLGNNNFHIASLKGDVTQTITEAQLPAFCAALEACYA